MSEKNNFKKNNFIHLHVHSEFSLLDGAVRIKKLIEKACQYEMPAVALTDHGVMYGVIEFYKEARKAGIKPIIGCEFYLAPKGRKFKHAEREGREDLSYHLTILAENNTGYKNLMKLVSLSFLEGFYYKPRIDKELLREYKDGLIALSGCVTGEIPKLIQAGKLGNAEKALQEYIEIFGKENFYLEIQDSGVPEQKIVNKALTEFSEKYGLPLVATNDVHYLEKEDSRFHDVLLCIQTGSTINEPGRLKFSTQEYYFKDSNQMQALFSDMPQAIENTFELAQRCNVDLKFNLNLIPSFEVPPPHTPDSYLEELCYQNAKRKYPSVTEEIDARIKKELEVIKKMGFAEYFLIVWDFVKFAKEHNIRVGPGRGSAAGSIVSYLLDITEIEPLRYGLLFERFLNEERKNMPDIDIDFCYEKRDEVIKYVSSKYGANRVAQLITFGTMAARQAIRDAGRVLEVPYAEVDRIAKMIPMEMDITIKDSLNLVPDLRQVYESNERIREVIDTAMSLEGIVRQDSIHAAGVVISSDDLYNYTPIQREGDGDIVTQYKMEDVQEIGLLKMDFLGLKTLSLIDKTLFLIKKTKGIEIDIDNISLEDRKTFEMLGMGECLGVFQLESSGMRELVLNLKPACFEDLIALLALYRPGPLQSGMVRDFIEAKNKRKEVQYIHPSLKPILESTYGIILYQEQVMRIASEIAGFSMAEADVLRDAISKKKRKVLSKQKNKFIEGAVKRGLDRKTSEKIFELINHFAEYGFNKSHSAAYALISYQTAYLKANYPVEFMAALLSIRMGSQEKVAQYVNEARRMGIEVLPPDINESYSDFTVVGNSIRFGLSAIKNVGVNVIEEIEKERKKGGKFKSFSNFCERIDNNVLNKKTIESLIKSGTFDSLGQSRKYLMENFEKIVEAAQKLKMDRERGQFSLFDMGAILETGGIKKDSIEEIRDKTKKDETNQGRAGQVGNGLAMFKDDSEEYPQRKLLNFEKEMLGLYVSGHPLLEYKEVLSELCMIENLYEREDRSTQIVGGVITRIKSIFTKDGKLMYFVNLEDVTDSVEVIVFPTVLEKYKEFLIENKIVKVKGKLDKKEDQIKIIASEIEELSRAGGKYGNGFNGSGYFNSNTHTEVTYKEDVNIVGENQARAKTKNETKSESKSFRKIIFMVRKNDLNHDFINELYETIRKNRGDTKVEFEITNGNGAVERRYELPENYAVSLKSEFFSGLREKFHGKINWKVI